MAAGRHAKDLNDPRSRRLIFVTSPMGNPKAHDRSFRWHSERRGVLNQVLPGDDFAESRVVRNELLNEFMDTVLEDIDHLAMFQAIADAARMALGRALAAVRDADLVEIAHQIAVAACERSRQ